MNFAAVFHRADAPYSYAVSDDEVILRLQTDHKVERVFLHWGDPFEAGILGGAERWTGQVQEVSERLELEYVTWWTVAIKPPYSDVGIILNCGRGQRSGFMGKMESVTRSGESLPDFISHGSIRQISRSRPNGCGIRYGIRSFLTASAVGAKHLRRPLGAQEG